MRGATTHCYGYNNWNDVEHIHVHTDIGDIAYCTCTCMCVYMYILYLGSAGLLPFYICTCKVQCVHDSLYMTPFPPLQYVSAESHGIASFPVQSPPPPGYPAHPHPSNTFPPGGTIPNRTAVPTTGQQPMAGDKCKQYVHVSCIFKVSHLYILNYTTYFTMN